MKIDETDKSAYPVLCVLLDYLADEVIKEIRIKNRKSRSAEKRLENFSVLKETGFLKTKLFCAQQSIFNVTNRTHFKVRNVF